MIAIFLCLCIPFTNILSMKDNERNYSINQSKDQLGYEVTFSSDTMKQLQQQYRFLQRPTLEEWVKTVKSKNKAVEVEEHLKIVAQTFFSLVTALEESNLDLAYDHFKKVSTLRKDGHESKDNELRMCLFDAYREQLEPEEENKPFVWKYAQEKENVSEDIDTEELNDEEIDTLCRKAWNNCTIELKIESLSRCDKVIYAAALLTNCSPEAWMHKTLNLPMVQKKETKTRGICIIH